MDISTQCFIFLFSLSLGVLIFHVVLSTYYAILGVLKHFKYFKLTHTKYRVTNRGANYHVQRRHWCCLYYVDIDGYGFDRYSSAYEALISLTARKNQLLPKNNLQRLNPNAKQFLDSKGEPLCVESVELSSDAVDTYISEGVKAGIEGTTE